MLFNGAYVDKAENVLVQVGPFGSKLGCVVLVIFIFKRLK